MERQADPFGEYLLDTKLVLLIVFPLDTIRTAIFVLLLINLNVLCVWHLTKSLGPRREEHLIRENCFSAASARMMKWARFQALRPAELGA